MKTYVCFLVILEQGSHQVLFFSITIKFRSRKENLARALEHEANGNSSAAYECYSKAVDISPSIAHELIQVTVGWIICTFLQIKWFIFFFNCFVVNIFELKIFYHGRFWGRRMLITLLLLTKPMHRWHFWLLLSKLMRLSLRILISFLLAAQE